MLSCCSSDDDEEGSEDSDFALLLGCAGDWEGLEACGANRNGDVEKDAAAARGGGTMAAGTVDAAGRSAERRLDQAADLSIW